MDGPSDAYTGDERTLNASDSQSRTERFVRYELQPAARRQYQIIALRIIAENGGRASIDQVKRAIQARHPDNRWDRRYPIAVLSDRDILREEGADVVLAEELTTAQTASLLAALDERSVRAAGLRVEDASWRPGAAEWTALRALVVERDGEVCAVADCGVANDLELDHIWRGSLLAAQGWSPQAINDPTNLQLLCDTHHGQKTASEAALIRLATHESESAP